MLLIYFRLTRGFPNRMAVGLLSKIVSRQEIQQKEHGQYLTLFKVSIILQETEGLGILFFCMCPCLVTGKPKT